MSTVETAGKIIKDLYSEDWEILLALEKYLPSHGYVLPEKMTSLTRLERSEIVQRLEKLEKKGLVMRRQAGYVLVNAGMDIISLKALKNRNLISSLGKPLYVSKKSDLYCAVSESGVEYILKFYRMGRTSFIDVERKRRCLSGKSQCNWILMSIQAAKTEFNTLRYLRDHGVSVPQVVTRERHVILMLKMDGVMLGSVLELDDPQSVLLKILANIKHSYVECGVINGDLSEYNVMINEKRVFFIDWPKAVHRSHANSEQLLDRDTLNILRFFKKQYGISYDLEAASFYVRGWRNAPTM